MPLIFAAVTPAPAPPALPAPALGRVRHQQRQRQLQQQLQRKLLSAVETGLVSTEYYKHHGLSYTLSGALSLSPTSLPGSESSVSPSPPLMLVVLVLAAPELVVAVVLMKLVELLLDKGADVNAQGGLYSNALQAASVGGDEKVVELVDALWLSRSSRV
jgi:hypothetical protein